MSPTFEEMGAMWLRDRAMSLRVAAEAADKAYWAEHPRDVCLFVAGKYRAAAVLMDDAATELEDRARGALGDGHA